MIKRNCQNCKKDIGHLEEYYIYYGQVVCKACMIKLEKQFQDTETTNGNIETETPIAEVRIEKENDTEFEGSLNSQSLNNALANSEQPADHNDVASPCPDIQEIIRKERKMKWFTLPPQKKLYSLCGLMLVIIVALIIDHIQLRQETARIKRAMLVVAAQAPIRSITSDDIERNVNNLDSEIDNVSNRLDDLESKVRRLSDLESKVRRLSDLELEISSLDSVTNDLDDKIDDVELAVQLLQSEDDEHKKHIKSIMEKVGMYVPWNL